MNEFYTIVTTCGDDRPDPWNMAFETLEEAKHAVIRAIYVDAGVEHHPKEEWKAFTIEYRSDDGYTTVVVVNGGEVTYYITLNRIATPDEIHRNEAPVDEWEKYVFG